MLLLLTLAALGHVILWVVLVNRIHALGIKRLLVHALTGVCGVAVTVIPIVVAVVIYPGLLQGVAISELMAAATWTYIVVCAVMCVVAIVKWLYLQRHPERVGALLTNHTSRFQPAEDGTVQLAAPGIATWFTRLPLNQALEIHVHEKELAIPRLAAKFAGLRIAHLSDLHMSGRIAKGYFEQVVDHVNRCEPDIVAITGDLVERTRCLDWIPDTLGRLCAPAGVYYVLGNHDRHVDKRRLHATLTRAGLVYLGGRWIEIAVRDIRLMLAGNELPWYRPAADFRDCPKCDASGLPLRVVLSHSPDQFFWAQEQEVDLMLAGHNHGGQVRLPLVGPIFAPSLHGVRYAAGVYRSGNTVMHVSRGTSCLTPIRVNCPPEIAVLTLRAAAGSSQFTGSRSSC
jgi:predicted MPP superfamily phosphohydrolase